MFGIGKKKKKNKDEDEDKTNGKPQNGKTETIREFTSHSTFTSSSSYTETRKITTRTSGAVTLSGLSGSLDKLKLERPSSNLSSILSNKPPTNLDVKSSYKRSSVPTISTPSFAYNRERINSTDALPFKQPTAPSTTSTYRSVYTREPFATYTPRLTATPSSSSSSSPFRPSPTPVQKSTSLSSVQPPLSASSSGSSSSKTVFFPTTPSTISSKSVLLPNPAYVDKTLKVKVVKCTKACDEGDSKVPMYKTSKKNRGRVLVINNVKFLDEKHYREGAEIDERNIVELFKQMGMKVVLHRNKKTEEMKKIITNYRKDGSLKHIDTNIVVVMSHGTGKERHDSTEVVGVDDQLLPTTWILEQFSNENCPDLCHKPKIFIFQCCRGSNKDIVVNNQIQHDAVPFLIPRKFSDMLIAYSTVPGFVSHRDPKTGTWYIQTICDVFMNHAHDTDVESMLKIVDEKLKNIVHEYNSRQTTSFENRGFKTLFLHPGL